MPDLYGVNGSSSSNTLRITGLATGMDTDTMVKKMMAAENMKLDKINQEKQYSQWKQESIRDIIKDFRDLRSKYLTIDSPDDTNLMKSFAYSGSTITATDGLGKATDSLVTASALPGAANGVSTISVESIAKSASIETISLNKNSASILNATNWNGNTIDFTINGIKHTTATITGVTGANNLMEKINDAINSNSELKGKVSASIDISKNEITFNSYNNSNIKVSSTAPELKDVKVINTTTETKLGDLGIVDTTFSIKQGGKESADINIKSTDTIQDLIKKIYDTKSDKNNKSDKAEKLYSNIKVSFSELTKKLTIETRKTGSSETLELAENSTEFTKMLSKTKETGKNAVVRITPPGGTETTVEKSTNDFTIDNVTYNLLKDPQGTPYTVTLTSKPDAQKTVDKIKDFVGKYNELMKKITDKVGEKKEYSYKPLTYEQKKEMKEDDIKTWEEKAKKGILKNDMELEGLANQMRRSFTDGIKDSGLSLKDIGIDTYGSFEAITKPGQLKIDEAKLKKAVETRGDQVMNLFTKDYDGPTPNFPGEHASKQQIEKYEKEYGEYKIKKYNESGIFERIEDVIYDSSVTFGASLLKRAGFEGTASEITNDLTKKIKDQDKKIREISVKLHDKETSYYNMFAKLETAMNKLNSQQSWLMQQLGGGK